MLTAYERDYVIQNVRDILTGTKSDDYYWECVSRALPESRVNPFYNQFRHTHHLFRINHPSRHRPLKRTPSTPFQPKQLFSPFKIGYAYRRSGLRATRWCWSSPGAGQRIRGVALFHLWGPNRWRVCCSSAQVHPIGAPNLVFPTVSTAVRTARMRTVPRSLQHS